MDLEDLFGNKEKHHHTQDRRNYYHEDSYENRYYRGNDENNYLTGLLNRIRNNRKLKIFILVFLVFIMLVVIGILAVLFPLIVELFNFISQNGLSGILEKAMEILNTLWSGAN